MKILRGKANLPMEKVCLKNELKLLLINEPFIFLSIR